MLKKIYHFIKWLWIKDCLEAANDEYYIGLESHDVHLMTSANVKRARFYAIMRESERKWRGK